MSNLDEVLNDAMDIIWDESTEALELVLTNIRQAKKKLDDAVKKSREMAAKMPVERAVIQSAVVEEASRQLEVALDQLMAFIEPMEDEEEEEEEPEPKPKKKPAAKKKVK